MTLTGFASRMAIRPNTSSKMPQNAIGSGDEPVIGNDDPDVGSGVGKPNEPTGGAVDGVDELAKMVDVDVIRTVVDVELVELVVEVEDVVVDDGIVAVVVDVGSVVDDAGIESAVADNRTAASVTDDETAVSVADVLSWPRPSPWLPLPLP